MPKKNNDPVLSAAYQADISRRDLFRALMAAAGTAVLFSSPLTARATPTATKETTEALANAQSRLDAAQKQMDDLAAQFQALSEKQDHTIGQIEDVNDKIEKTKGKIKKKQEELSDKQELLSDRVSSNYKSGDGGALQMLLTSTTLDDLISRAYYLGKVNRNDERAIDDVREVQRELDAQKKDLESQKSSLEQLEADQTEQLKQMKSKKDEVQNLLDGLDQDVKDLMSKRDAELLAAAQQEEAARQAQLAAANRPSPNRPATSIPGSGQSAGSAGNLQQSVVDACHRTPSPGLGYCAWWVSNVFKNAGLGPVYGNADDMYAAFCTSSRKSELQVGMIIAVASHSHTAAGRIYGHVGIYVGDNTVMDNIGYIRSINVDSWISYYGDIVTPRWGWANGINLAG